MGNLAVGFRELFLLIRSLFWTAVGPGTVTLVIPYLIVTRWQPAIIGIWGVAQFVSLILMAFGAAILFYSIWRFAADGRGTLSPLDAPRQLVVHGLYRYVRNPMYLGVLLILLGEAALFESVGLAGYALAWFIVVNVVILVYEEPALRRQFGVTYERYCSDVGRWIPRKRNVAGPSGENPTSATGNPGAT